MASEDERGFTKAEMQVWDPRQANFQETGTTYYATDSIFVRVLQITYYNKMFYYLSEFG